MRKLLVLPIAAAITLVAGAALAEDDVAPNAEEQKSITAALDALGCKGWDEIEKETKPGGGYHFEIDDTTCTDGQYDVKLDKDFKLLSKSRD